MPGIDKVNKRPPDAGPPEPQKPKQIQLHSPNLTLLLICALLFFLWHILNTNSGNTREVSYSEFRQFAEDQRFKSIEISPTHLIGTLSSPDPDGVLTVKANIVDPAMAEQFADYDAELSGSQQGGYWQRLIGSVGPLLLLLLFWWFVLKRMSPGAGGGLMPAGKSHVKSYQHQHSEVSFDDVAGVDEAKEELQEIINFLRDPQAYGRLGGHIPHGILLVGPPGTGKTLLARAIAGEAEVPFFSINGSEFVEMFVGVGAARVRDLFQQAREVTPCIIFIDELDALGRARGMYPGSGGHDEKEQTLNQLLSEMDGFDPSEGIVLLAATNRPEILDPALLRAGRFDRQVLVDRPDRKGRAAILKVHLKKITLDAAVTLEEVAALTTGFTGADLANLVNEAALLATRRDAEAVTMSDINNAIERIIAGLEKRSRLLNERERKIIAYHEMGHALTAMAIPGSDPVHKISIIPRGIGGLGYTIQRPLEDRYLMTQRELQDKMTILLGGRAAEHLFFGHLSTGAADDLDKATDIARSMITRYGMANKLGHVTYDQVGNRFLDNQPVSPTAHLYSDETAREIDCEIRQLTAAAFERATQIISEQRTLLEHCAAQLLESETLSVADIDSIKTRLEQQASTVVPLKPDREQL